MYYQAFIGILCDGEMLSLSSAKFASPLGLNVIGTTIKKDFPEVFVRIYNLEVNQFSLTKLDIENIIKSFRNVLVGLTLIAGNIFKSLGLAEWLKGLGCDIIIGGPEVNELTMNHFSAISTIDSVVAGSGEQVISDIIKDGIKQRIYSASSAFNFDDSSVDYSLLFRLQDYGGVSMLWGGDCHLHNQRCYFCSRQKKGFGWREPKLVWKEMVYPHKNGINKIYNTADTVAVNLKQLELLAESKPLGLAGMRMKCFINATQVNDETALLLKKLNAWAAVGIESFSRTKTIGKGKTEASDNYRAIEILAKHGVPMILTFVMGLPGETEESLNNDAKEIIRIVNSYKASIYWITVSPLLITLGSMAFYECAEKLGGKLPRKNEQEFYNPLLMSEEYFKMFCQIDIDDVYKKIAYLKKEIKKIAPQIIFDSKGLDPERWLRIKKSS